MLHSFGLVESNDGAFAALPYSGGLQGRRWARHAPVGGMSAVLASLPPATNSQVILAVFKGGGGAAAALFFLRQKPYAGRRAAT